MGPGNEPPRDLTPPKDPPNSTERHTIVPSTGENRPIHINFSMSIALLKSKLFFDGI